MESIMDGSLQTCLAATRKNHQKLQFRADIATVTFITHKNDTENESHGVKALFALISPELDLLLYEDSDFDKESEVYETKLEETGLDDNESRTAKRIDMPDTSFETMQAISGASFGDFDLLWKNAVPCLMFAIKYEIDEIKDACVTSIFDCSDRTAAFKHLLEFVHMADFTIICRISIKKPETHDIIPYSSPSVWISHPPIHRRGKRIRDPSMLELRDVPFGDEYEIIWFCSDFH